MNAMPDRASPPPDPRDANRRVAWRLIGLLVGMFGVSFALVPLYDVFCRVTGLNGKTGRIEASAVDSSATGRKLRVEFVANLNQRTHLEFEAMTASMRVATGEIREIRYRVANPTAQAVVARAVPSVAPARAARYFNKVECFCFSEQRVEPGQSLEMPARFVVDPELPADVHVITLSYTFFARPGDAARLTLQEVDP